MTDLSSFPLPTPDSLTDIERLADQFFSESEKNQLPLISKLETLGEAGWQVLMDYLRSPAVQTSHPNLVTGKAYVVLYNLQDAQVQNFLATHFPQGVIPLTSARNIDYSPLQQALAQQKFELADNLTREKLCELAGEGAIQRKWLYFTEVEKFPSDDLHTINALWWVHSEGKFGFSVQRKLWLGMGKDFVKLWPKIGWKSGNSWTKYPREFIWDMSAPVGHLPLLNQLRGVRVAASIFSHPVWSERNW
ncbi:MAG: GUN4 N-terminal ARM-like repeat domain-containing protein [Snowella sp.]|nr:GUN4 N-terminal ARM-like repeat domain-containing protein [Snowella sp.]